MLVSDSDNPAEKSEASPQPHSDRQAWVVLAILYFVYVSSMADRHILSILAPQIKEEMGLSDAQVGILIGPAIALLYGILGIPLSHLADRVNRKRFLAISLALWSLSTALGAAAMNMWQLALSRLGVSASEAGGIPAATSILADLFPPHRRALALSIYATGSTCGIFVSFGLGGYLGHLYGWRVALLAAGLPGLLLCVILLLFVIEPKRGGLDSHHDAAASGLSILSTIGHLLKIRPYRYGLIGATLLNMAIGTTLSWGPSYIIRKFDLNAGSAGPSLGLGIAVIGGFFILLGGIIASRFGPAKVDRAVRTVALAQIASFFLFLLLIIAPNFPVAVLALSLVYGTMHLYVATWYYIAQNVVPFQMRAAAIALGVLTMTLAGYGVAPPLIGLFSDLLRPTYGASSLDLAITPVTLAIRCAAFFFRRASLSLRPEPKG